MKKRAILAEIIVWTILLSIIFSGIIFTYSKIFVEPNIYNIDFKDIDGITKGSPVRFMGINVGYVRKLKSKNKHIQVQIIITQKDMKIPNGTVARVEFYGLGGSKSIELMPPDGSCDVGIVTGDTIRINDVAQVATGFVDIMEQIEKYIKSLDKAGMEKFFNQIKNTNDEQIKEIGKEIQNINSNMTQKIEKIKTEQNQMVKSIKKADETVDKLNEFIKK